MRRSHRTVHLISLLAVIIGLFGPILTSPVTAAIDLPQPAVALNTDDVSGLSTPESDQPRAVPVLPELIPVIPMMPTLTEAACADGAVNAQTAVEVPTEGVSYTISSPDETGAFVVTATLVDANVYTWSSSRLDGWEVSGNIATASGVVALCPESEPDISVPPATAAADTPDESQMDEGEIVLSAATAAADQPEDDAADELEAPTTGRGPARENASQRMSINAAATDLTISKTANPTANVSPGNIIIYTIRVTNDTGIDQHYSFVDHLPDDVTLEITNVPYPAEGDVCTNVGGDITCGLAAGMVLYPGWADTWTITVTVGEDAVTDDTCEDGLMNTVEGDWGGTASASTTLLETVCDPELDLNFAFRADNPVLELDESDYSFTLTVTNNTYQDAEGIELVFSSLFNVLNTWWVLTSNSALGDCSYQGLNNVLICTDLTVPSKTGNTPGVLTLTLTHTIDNPRSGTDCGTVVTPTATLDDGGYLTELSASMNVSCDVTWEMDITADKTTVVPGDSIIYTFEPTNVGGGTVGVAADRKLFEFYFPVEYEPTSPDDISASGVHCDLDSVPPYFDSIGGVYTCSIQPGTISAGQNFSLDFPFDVTEDFPTDQCPQISISVDVYTTTVWNWAHDPVLPTVPLDCTADRLQLDISTDDQDVRYGDTFNYQVVTKSELQEYSGAFTWVLTLPNGVVVDAAKGLPDGCSEDYVNPSNLVICAFSRNYGRGDTSTITIPVAVTNESYGLVCNGLAKGDTVSSDAVVTGTGDIWHPDYKTDSVDTTILCDTILTANASVSPAVVNPGEPYVIAVEVTGGGNENVDFSFTVPFATYPGNYGYLHTNRLTCNQHTFPFTLDCVESDPNTDTTSNFDEPYRLDFQIYAPLNPWDGYCADGIPIWAYPIRGPWDSLDTEPSTKLFINCQELGIAQGASADSVRVGEEFDYTLNVSNSGRNSHGTYGFTDTLPPGIELADTNAITSPAGTTCTPAHNGGRTAITCVSEAGPPLDDEHSYTFRVKANYALDNGVCGEVSSTATGTTGMWGQDTATASTEIECVSEITLTNTPISEQVVPGGTIAYGMTLKNSGDYTITSGTITNMLPPLPEGGEWSFMVNGTPVDVSPFDYEFTDLATHEEITFRIESSVIPDDLQLPETEWCTSWTNTIAVEGISTEGVDVSGEQSASVQVNCTGLSIDMSVADNLIPVGGQVEYTITVTNHGNTSVSQMLVALDHSGPDAVFSNLQANSEATQDCGWIAGPNPGCMFVSLDSQDSVTLTVTGDAPAIPTWEQCAEVEAKAMFNFGASQNTVGLQQPGTWVLSSPVSTQLDCKPEVTIGMNGEVDTGGNDRIDAGDTITYTIEVLNSGNMMLYDTIVTANPAGLNWNTEPTIPELLPGTGQSLTATYTITQSDMDVGELTFTASVTASLVPEATFSTLQFVGLAQTTQPLPVLTQSVSNDVTETLVLTQQPGIGLTVTGEMNTGGDSELNEGDTITYSYTVTNSGNVTMTDFELLTDMEGLVFADGTSIATLAPGGEATLTATYTVTTADVAAGAIEMCADVSATDPDSTSIRDADQCVHYVVAQPLPITPTPTMPLVTPEPIATVPTTQEPATPTPANPTPTPVPATPAPAAPEPATPTPATPGPATSNTPVPETPAAVTSLPETGFGGLAGMAPVLGLAAIMAMLLLAVSAAGVRRKE